MGTITTTWTDLATVISTSTLARTTTTSGTLALTTKVGAYVFIRVGRTASGSLSNGVDVLVRRTLVANTIQHAGAIWVGRTSIASAVSATVSSDASSGQASISVTGGTGFSAGDYVVIGAATSREEWARLAAATAGTLLLDDTLRFTHTAVQADTIYNQAFIPPPIWIDGGCTAKVVIDYGDDSSGASVRVEALAQTYDSDTTT